MSLSYSLYVALSPCHSTYLTHTLNFNFSVALLIIRLGGSLQDTPQRK